MSTRTSTHPAPSATSLATGLGPVGLVLLAAMLWGTTGTAQHFAPGDLSAYWVGSLRMLMAALFFGVLALCARPQAGIAQPRQPTSRMGPRILFCGLCMAVYNLSFFAGVRACGVALGTALAIGSGPIWAGFMQAAVQKRWPAALWWLGTCIGVSGGIVMALASTGAAGGLPWHGMALCLLAGMSYAAYALANQALVRAGPVARANARVFGCAALLSLPCAALLGGPLHTTPEGWAVVAYLGVVATGCAYLLFSMGLRGMSVATGVALSKAEPITAFALSLAVVGERPAWWAVLGLAAVICGLWLVVRAEMREAGAPD
ncbi:DMT family transporter [Comamonas terrae]|uniref:DMT family transporter n=1 Tax=Comamonas terrae TaxID=673548 RepID=A0ABW5UJ64_9BURK